MDALDILITGGNGFIGSHLADRLFSEGHHVRIYDTTFNNNTAHLDCEKVKGDVLDRANVEAQLASCDIVYHLAAVSRVEWGELEPDRCISVNVQGSLNLVRAVSKMRKPATIIWVSSREVYGEPKSLPVTERDEMRPISIYGMTKAAGELILSNFAPKHQLSYTIFRLSNVYGSERDLPERVIPRFAQLALRNLPLTVNGGKQVLDFTFIDDVVDLLASMPSHLGNPEIDRDVFLLATGVGTSLLELPSLIVRIFNSSSTVRILPQRSYDVQSFIGDCGKASRKLGFVPKTGLMKGLETYRDRLMKRGLD